MSAAAHASIEQVGPYRVMTRLAAGGMSEILLARRAGPVGLERLVVIKRMLPELVADPDVRSALVDEARIMLGLRHPNVCAVQELACEGDELYLVLEYLRGDSLLALCRALRAHKLELPLSLAVHVGSEICAGLHAAHELADEDGEPLRVVHRDVSPHNVFVTFEGEVKLIDFGIASFVDRLARTRSGVVKGKFAYMAPEQFHCEPLDRRTDVFAAGIVLHELLTGQRLFARKNDKDLLMAILADPVPRPSELAPARGIPDALDAICMRALSRDREERFPSAGAMRTALREQLPALDPTQDAREVLASLTRRVLPKRLAEVDALRSRARRPPTERFRREPAQAVETSIEVDVEAPISERELRARQRSWRPRIVASVALALGLAAAAVVLAPRPEGGSSAPPAIAAPPPSAVRVTIETMPPGATVRLAGEPRGLTPLVLELPRDRASLELTLELEGHAPMRRTLVPDETQQLVLQLAPVDGR